MQSVMYFDVWSTPGPHFVIKCAKNKNNKKFEAVTWQQSTKFKADGIKAEFQLTGNHFIRWKQLASAMFRPQIARMIGNKSLAQVWPH